MGTHENTVLDGNLPRDHGGPYRIAGEGLPSLWGKNSVPVGKDYRTSREVSRGFFLQIEAKFEGMMLRLFMLVH